MIDGESDTTNAPRFSGTKNPEMVPSVPENGTESGVPANAVKGTGGPPLNEYVPVTSLPMA